MALYASANPAHEHRRGRLTMTDPTGGAPNPEVPIPAEPAGAWPTEPATAPSAAAPAAPPAAAAPPPAGGNWQTPPPPAQPAEPASPIQVPQQYQPVAVADGPAPGLAYGDVVTRIIALVIDSIILWIPYMILSTILVGALFATGGAIGTIFSLVIGFAYAALAGVYFVWTWTTQRASYGQKFLKLETVNATDGATLTRDQAIKRFLFLYAGNLIAIIGQNVFGLALGTLLGIVGLGYVIYLLYTTSKSPKRQGFHDIQASTVVVKHL
jgi:hypothetical protein